MTTQEKLNLISHQNPVVFLCNFCLCISKLQGVRRTVNACFLFSIHSFNILKGSYIAVKKDCLKVGSLNFHKSNESIPSHLPVGTAGPASTVGAAALCEE